MPHKRRLASRQCNRGLQQRSGPVCCTCAGCATRRRQAGGSGASRLASHSEAAASSPDPGRHLAPDGSGQRAGRDLPRRRGPPPLPRARRRRARALPLAHLLLLPHEQPLPPTRQTPEPNLARGMRQLNGVYAQSFNRRHARVSHLLQGRLQRAARAGRPAPARKRALHRQEPGPGGPLPAPPRVALVEPPRDARSRASLVPGDRRLPRTLRAV